MNLNCKKDNCKFKIKENGYCGKHQRTYILEKAKNEGKRICDIFRGCFTELSANEKKCKPCREKAQLLEKKIYTAQKAIFEEKLESNNTIFNCSICKVEYTKYTTQHKKVSRVCPKCHEKQQEIEKKRVRDRNYQEEAKRNSSSYWKSFCRIAEKRNKENTLLETDFTTIISKPCFYCGYTNDKEVLGIDRLDNNKGYSVENCVTSCKICNRMKHIFHPSFFIEKANIITIYRKMNQSMPDFYKKWDIYNPVKAPSFKTFHTQTTKKRDITINIIESEYITLTREKCYLCGFQSDKGIGLDRIDSTKREYSIENIKPCCGSCNMMKADIDLDTFYTYMNKISNIHTIIPEFTDIPKEKFLMGGAKSKYINTKSPNQVE